MGDGGCDWSMSKYKHWCSAIERGKEKIKLATHAGGGGQSVRSFQPRSMSAHAHLHGATTVGGMGNMSHGG